MPNPSRHSVIPPSAPPLSLSQRLLGWGALAYGQSLASTLRWREFPDTEAQAALADGPAILCFWHQHILMLARPMQRLPRMAALVSRSRHGGAAALAVAHFGILPIRASRAKPGKRDKGGLDGVLEMHAHLANGGLLALAADGPRGPARHCPPGLAQLARFSGAPLIGLGLAAAPCFRAKSWDLTALPPPLARAALVWGKPLIVSRRANGQELAEASLSLEAGLNALDERARDALRASR